VLSREQDIVHANDVLQIVGWPKTSLECYDGLTGNAAVISGLGGLHQGGETNESSVLFCF